MFLRNKEKEGFRESQNRKFIYMSCTEDTCDQNAGPQYNLDRLLENNINPFMIIKAQVKEWGFLMALLVICLECLKLMAFFVMLIITFLNEGIEGVIALGVSVLSCNSISSYRKIKRNKRKFELKEKGSEKGEDKFGGM